MTRRIVVASVVCGLAVTCWVNTSSRAQELVSFTRDIQPIIQANCLACHGQAIQLSKLDLRSRETAVKGGDKGAAIVPGKADESRLYRLVAGLERPRMPLDGALSAEQISTIKNWIDQGAHWDESAAEVTRPSNVSSNASAAFENMEIPPEARNYWAFKLPVQSTLPNVAPNYQNPIDRIVEKGRQDKGLKAAPRADRLTLLRRAYLDLIGLPPTPEETAEYLADNRSDAWPRLIDKLLASPHYGERWGRHWLDVARYADTNGFEQDVERPSAWMYRDYVVRSFNEDKPYNVFLTEQIAGDEIPAKSEQTLIATGFLRAGPRVAFREKDNPERRFDYLDEVIATIGKGVLGLTVQCARCHNHKFDPIPQKDYYRLQAALFGYVETTLPLVPKAEAEAYQPVAEVRSTRNYCRFQRT